MASALQIRTIVSRPFEENTYVIWRSGRKDALVIDAGLEPDLILDFLKENDLAPAGRFCRADYFESLFERDAARSTPRRKSHEDEHAAIF